MARSQQPFLPAPNSRPGDLLPGTCCRLGPYRAWGRWLLPAAGPGMPPRTELAAHAEGAERSTGLGWPASGLLRPRGPGSSWCCCLTWGKRQTLLHGRRSFPPTLHRAAPPSPGAGSCTPVLPTARPFQTRAIAALSYKGRLQRDTGAATTLLGAAVGRGRPGARTSAGWSSSAPLRLQPPALGGCPGHPGPAGKEPRRWARAVSGGSSGQASPRPSL